MRDLDDFGPTWVLLRPLPHERIPASIRMRRALKALLRGYGIKVEGMQTAAPGPGPAAPAAGGPVRAPARPPEELPF